VQLQSSKCPPVEGGGVGEMVCTTGLSALLGWAGMLVTEAAVLLLLVPCVMFYLLIQCCPMVYGTDRMLSSCTFNRLCIYISIFLLLMGMLTVYCWLGGQDDGLSMVSQVTKHLLHLHALLEYCWANSASRRQCPYHADSARHPASIAANHMRVIRS
jgi:hypothetical protein